MVPNLEIIVGTYEEFLLGYKISTKEDGYSLTQSFADKSHSGAVKCVATNGFYVATGGSDDRIFIYDMKSRKQSQILLSHEGTVNALAFTPDQTHLFSGGSDGNLIATRLGSWTRQGFWKKAHDGAAVTEISCHPSGKLALTLGTDLSVRTWNLVKGRIAYKTNLKSRHSLGRLAECVAWSQKGSYFTIAGRRILDIWSIQKADVVKSIQTQSRPTCLRWVDDECGILGMESGKLLWFSSKASFNKENTEIDAHDTRVKAMDLLKDVLATAASAGEIKLWLIDTTKLKLSALTSINIGCRPTCLCLLDLEPLGVQEEVNPARRYEVPSKEEQSHEKTNPSERGVVTIEYEQDDENGNDQRQPLVTKSAAKKLNQAKNRKLSDKNKRKSNQSSRTKKTDTSSDDDDSIDDGEDGDSSDSYASDDAPPIKKRQKPSAGKKQK